PAVDYAMGAGSDPYNVEVADRNHDGKPDVVVVLNGYNDLAVMLGDGTGAFPTTTLISLGANTGPATVAIADFNGDGKLDMLTGNVNSNDASMLLGNGDGT